MITLTDTELTLLKLNLKLPQYARVGDYLVRIGHQTLLEDDRDDSWSRNCIYYLHRITRKTKSSLYTGGHIGEKYWRWAPFLGAGNALEVVYPREIQMLSSVFLEDHIVREIANNRDLGLTVVFQENLPSRCRQFDLESHSHPKGCERYPKIFYKSFPESQVEFCKNCWDDLKEHL